MPYYADIGAGTSNWIWQAFLGLGYRFDWGAVTLAWRALGYDFSLNDAKLTLAGPGLSISIRCGCRRRACSCSHWSCVRRWAARSSASCSVESV